MPKPMEPPKPENQRKEMFKICLSVTRCKPKKLYSLIVSFAVVHVYVQLVTLHWLITETEHGTQAMLINVYKIRPGYKKKYKKMNILDSRGKHLWKKIGPRVT